MQLGLGEKDLLEVEMKLNGANGSQLRIMGGVFLVISGTDTAGKLYETHQLCYVAEGVEKLLLSKEACVKLGILPKSFPSVGGAVDQRPVVGEISDGPNADQFDLEPCAPEEDGSAAAPEENQCQNLRFLTPICQFHSSGRKLSNTMQLLLLISAPDRHYR